MSSALRFKGFALIVNTLLPFALLVGLGLFFNTLYTTLKAELQRPVNQLIEDAGQLAGHAKEAAAAVETAAVLAQANTADVVIAVENLVEPFSEFDIQLPDLAIPVPKGIECKWLKVGYPAPHRATDDIRPMKAVFHENLPKIELQNPFDPKLKPLPPSTGTPPPVLPSPGPGPLPGAITGPVVQEPLPDCTLTFQTWDVFQGVSKAINDELAAAFAEPRAQIKTISASVKNMMDAFNALKPLTDGLRAQAVEFTNRAAQLAETRDALAAKLVSVFQIAFWVSLAVLLWLVVSAGWWATGRLATGAYLLSHGRYPPTPAA